jgi:hypothetical protein
MATESNEALTLDEARRRWLAEREEPIGPGLFLGLCAAHDIRVTPHAADVIRTYVQALYTRRNAYGVVTGEARPKRMPDIAFLGFQLSRALRGIVHESELRLKVNMVPKLLYRNNLRRALPKTAWTELRRRLIEERGCVCEVCGAAIPNPSDVDAHEEWDYDTGKRPPRATVTRILLACPKCHATVHFGLQYGLVKTGKLPARQLEVIAAHFCAVNKVGSAMFDEHVSAATERWTELNRRKSWHMDFGPYQQLVDSHAAVRVIPDGRAAGP